MCSHSPTGICFGVVGGGVGGGGVAPEINRTIKITQNIHSNSVEELFLASCSHPLNWNIYSLCCYLVSGLFIKVLLLSLAKRIWQNLLTSDIPSRNPWNLKILGLNQARSLPWGKNTQPLWHMTWSKPLISVKFCPFCPLCCVAPWSSGSGKICSHQTSPRSLHLLREGNKRPISCHTPSPLKLCILQGATEHAQRPTLLT